MLRRAVQKRPYDWEPLLPAVLQAYRSTPSESTGFTPSRLVFGREMHLPVDIGIPLPEPPRDIRTYANILSEDLEWAYKVAREVIGTQHKRAETRYNDHVSRSYLNQASSYASFNMDGTMAPHQNSCRTTLACVKCWRSEAQSLRFGSSTHAASSRRTTTPFGSRHLLRIAFLLPRLLHRTQMIVRRSLHQTLVTERRHLRRL